MPDSTSHVPWGVSERPPRKERRFAVPFLLSILMSALACALFFQHAWVSEDAYITFRSVEQFYAGNGPRWNPHERVQAFTHPAWFFLLSACRLITQDLYLASLVLGIVLSSSVICILAYKGTDGIFSSLTPAAILLSSKSWVDFSTSGLENPLSHLLLLLFFLSVRAHSQKREPTSLYGVFFTLSLLLLTRHDLILLTLPALWFLLLRKKTRLFSGELLKTVLIGGCLFIAWSLFALFYYGAPLPNTALAKLSTGVPFSISLQQGLNYFQNSLTSDWVTLPTIALGFVLALRARSHFQLALAAGIFIYLLYVLVIGGDFMSGRFFTAPLLVAVLAIQRSSADEFQGLLIAPLILSTLNPLHPIRSEQQWKSGTEKGIADEKAVYWSASGFRRCYPQRACPAHRNAHLGRVFKGSSNRVKVWPNVGFFGYFAGNDKIIVDELALTDPLLARLPARNPRARIGHFARTIPAGYLESLESGSNKIGNASLREYYEKVQLITQGPLWSKERLIEIVKLNLGSYNYLVHEYLNTASSRKSPARKERPAGS